MDRQQRKKLAESAIESVFANHLSPLPDVISDLEALRELIDENIVELKAQLKEENTRKKRDKK